MSFRALLLIVAAGVVLHIAALPVCTVLVGYFGFASLDKWLANRAREAAIDYEISGWIVDSKDPESESRGALSREKLPNKDQIVVTRIAELLRRIR
jgi:hypothetical protein